MMKNKIGLLACALLLAMACGDSTSGTGDNATGGDMTPTTGDAGKDPVDGKPDGGGNDPTGGTNTTGDGNDEGGMPAGGACTNASDAAALMSFNPGTTASGCGTMCLDDKSCEACYAKDANFAKVTPGCRTCWVKITRCVADKCVLVGGLPTGPCFTAAEGKACADCRVMKCNDDFEKCSGLDPEKMP